MQEVQCAGGPVCRRFSVQEIEQEKELEQHLMTRGAHLPASFRWSLPPPPAVPADRSKDWKKSHKKEEKQCNRSYRFTNVRQVWRNKGEDREDQTRNTYVCAVATPASRRRSRAVIICVFRSRSGVVGGSRSGVAGGRRRTGGLGGRGVWPTL